MRSESLDKLVKLLSCLPGIGRKTAVRLSLHVIQAEESYARQLADALVAVKERIRPCSLCCGWTEEKLCRICRQADRDSSMVCVVESTPDLWAIEGCGSYHGLYHVLGGLLRPLDGIGPRELNIAQLHGRMEGGGIRELIMATSPSVDGEATALYLSDLLGETGVRVTRIAAGVPMGGDLEYASGLTLAKALEGRRRI